jgi:hypothetical protein
MPYIIKDENGDLMRVVRRQEEARQIIDIREGWTMHHIKQQKQTPEDVMKLFERAPF